MLFLPLDFHKVKIEELACSGAYVNAISERDGQSIRQHVHQCIIHEAPPSPIKVQYANAELEQPLATYTMHFPIGDYNFEEAFLVMAKRHTP